MKSGPKMTRSKRGIKIGRPRKHGGYCLSLARDELLKREHPLVRRYLEETREGLVRDVAGNEGQLTEQQRILIDRIISRLAICRLIEIYVSKNGAFAKRGDKTLPELVPALGSNYLSYVNAIDRAVIALGLERKKAEDALDLKAYLKLADEAKSQAKTRKASSRAGNRPAEAEGQSKAEVARGLDKAEIVNPGASSEGVSGQPEGGIDGGVEAGQDQAPAGGEIGQPGDPGRDVSGQAGVQEELHPARGRDGQDEAEPRKE